MREIYLKRVGYTDKATFGVLTENGVPFVVTLEDAWYDNQPFISCIPTGRYLCRRVLSPKFGNTFTVEGIPDRSLIRFHWGQTEDDTEGCILLAEKFDPVKGKPGIAESKIGFKQFLDTLSGESEFYLTITEC